MSPKKLSGLLFLLLGPSGSGKGTLGELLLKKHPEIKRLKSYTTRLRREDKRSDDFYYFISEAEFERKIQAGFFLEWKRVHAEHCYGTGKAEVLTDLKQGKLLMKEIDIEGYKELLKTEIKDKLVSIFFVPPEGEELARRIMGRGNIDETELARRLASAQKELAQKDLCDYLVSTSGRSVEESYKEVEEIIQKVMK
ncbi:hypothetical protein AUJ78_00950 [Candidatus Peregrinibacteria bacterium CG1_02_41_10]|nr:MAG: hypothetical protein AUJ78_00950 [Candidatus Peregrinibacteria bacterium CG1_02_41_10]